MVGCTDGNNESIVKDEKFTIEEEEFKEVYEEVNDKNLPTNITYAPEVISMMSGNKQQVIELLKATEKLFDSDEARRLKESIQDNEDDIPNKINANEFSISFYKEYGDYRLFVNPFKFKE